MYSSRPHYHEHEPTQYYDDDDRDYFIVKKRPSKIQQKKKKITVEVNDYDEQKYDDVQEYHKQKYRSEEYEKEDDEYDREEESEEEFYKHLAHRKRKRPHHYKSRRPHYGHRGKRRRKILRKKLIWDRHSGGNYDTPVEDDDIAELDLDEIDETIPYQDTDYDDGSRLPDGSAIKKKNQNGRNGGESSQKQIESLKLDRNYGQIFEPSSPAVQGVHRNIPTEYFSKEQSEEQEEAVPSFTNKYEESSNRRMDLDNFFDRTVGRGFRSAGESSDIDFNIPPNRNLNNSITVFSGISTTTMMPLLNVTSLNYKKNGKEKAVFDIPGRVRRVYSKWSKWSKCSAKCTTRRFK